METVKGSRGTSVLLAPDMAASVRFVVRYMEDRGHELLLTEGYRPVGVPSDQYVTVEARTSTGGSNQWFQWGRYQRGLTPSAAWPGTSRHGSGVAIDWNAPTQAGMQARAEAMHMVGLVANVPSESWHAEPLGAVLVDLTPYRAATTPTTAKKTAALIKEDAMWLTKTKDTNRIYLITSQGVHWLRSIDAVKFIRRLIEHHGGNGDEHVFYQKEVDVIEASIKAAAGNTTQTDPKTLAKHIATEIKGDVAAAVAKLDVKVGATADEIADEIARRLVEG